MFLKNFLNKKNGKMSQITDKIIKEFSEFKISESEEFQKTKIFNLLEQYDSYCKKLNISQEECLSDEIFLKFKNQLKKNDDLDDLD